MRISLGSDTIAITSVRPLSGGTQTRGLHLRLVIAFFFPWLTFFTIGRPFAGIVCLLLQITVLGWIPATIWAVYALSQYKTDQKIHRALSRQY
jgi:uncharacterized membrane protein YqaE (UPF0057 family)